MLFHYVSCAKWKVTLLRHRTFIANRGKLYEDEYAKKPSDTHSSAQLSNEQHNSSKFSTNPENELIGNGSLHL